MDKTTVEDRNTATRLKNQRFPLNVGKRTYLGMSVSNENMGCVRGLVLLDADIFLNVTSRQILDLLSCCCRLFSFYILFCMSCVVRTLGVGYIKFGSRRSCT